MLEFKNEIEKLIRDREFDKALNLINNQISSDADNIELYIIRGDFFYIQQKFPNALNDYNKVLKKDKNNKLIMSKVEMIKEILKFEAVDIFASTNLNNDPWLD